MSNRPSIPAEIAREVLVESGHRCAVCGAGSPLERAHIIPWHKSREHKTEDLICLCANCHQRADLEKWGEKTLRKYKQRPWVMRQYENTDNRPETTTTLDLTIEIELEDFNEKNQRWLQYAIAAFLEIPPNAVRVASIETGSVKITVELPTPSAERLLSAYKRNDSELVKYLAPLVLLDLHRKRQGLNGYPQESAGVRRVIDVPFQAVGPLSADSPVYIERKADREVLRHMHRMDYVQIIEPRQQGKTGLIYRMRGALYNSVYALAYVNIEDLKSKDEATWYQDLAARLVNQLWRSVKCDDLSTPTDAWTWRSFLKDLVTSEPYAADVKPRLIIAIDKLGRIPRGWAEDFFRVLRAVYDGREVETYFRNLTFVLAGAFDPRDLISDGDSPFNVAQWVNLEDFDYGQVKQLVTFLRLPADETASVAERVYHWTSGQPCLTQKLCLYLSQRNDIIDAHAVDAAVDRLFREDRIHLSYIVRDLKKDAQLLSYFWEVVADPVKFTPSVNPFHFRLANVIGVIKPDERGCCQIRNRIYERALQAVAESLQPAEFVSLSNNHPIGGGKMIKILFLAANPSDTTRLRVDEESRAIDEALRKAEFRESFDIRQHWAVRVVDLQGYLLRHRPDIVHFSGHGSESNEIILEDNSGNSRAVSVRALGQLFAVLKDNIRCVVLNACYSEAQAQAIAEHIDCVVGMSGSIGDSAAVSFATAFYQALGFGRNVKTAFDLGCVQIDLESLDEQDIPKLITPKSNPEEIVFVQSD